MAGVYLSYPFCAQKCTYCNFASGVLPRDLEPRYVHALKKELNDCSWPWTPETVYLGGGTPSQMDPAALAALLQAIPGAPWREATLEAAPGTITKEKALAWRAMGMNRVSLGVQSFVASELKRTGRRHRAETVLEDVATLRAANINSISIDLIAGLPTQTPESWRRSLDFIERLNVPHASIYMLEVDEDSRLGLEILNNGARYGAREVPSEDRITEFYETAVERLSGTGLARYEISNFARPGWESAHNLKYWRREPYLGFGADAHSFNGSVRWQNVESAEEYSQLQERGASTIAERTEADGLSEEFYLGLRLAEGVDLDWGPFEEPIGRFLRDGLLEADGRRLRLTPRGVMVSNEVFMEFLPAVAA